MWSSPLRRQIPLQMHKMHPPWSPASMPELLGWVLACDEVSIIQTTIISLKLHMQIHPKETLVEKRKTKDCISSPNWKIMPVVMRNVIRCQNIMVDLSLQLLIPYCPLAPVAWRGTDVLKVTLVSLLWKRSPVLAHSPFPLTSVSLVKCTPVNLFLMGHQSPQRNDSSQGDGGGKKTRTSRQEQRKTEGVETRGEENLYRLHGPGKERQNRNQKWSLKDKREWRTWGGESEAMRKPEEHISVEGKKPEENPVKPT